MGFWDFLFGKSEVKNKWAKHKTKKPVEKKKVELGVCIPQHAKKGKTKKEVLVKESPFEKLIKKHNQKEFNEEVEEIVGQQPHEPFDYEPDLGVEEVAAGKTEKKEEPEKEDELDAAARKMSEGYVPKFSAVARKKLGYEDNVPAENKTIRMKKAPVGKAQFEVTGVYYGSESVISGEVISGTITKRMSAPFANTTLKISDLKTGVSSVKELTEGQRGTIFTRGKIGLLKSGTILEFS